jgi:predicted RNA-binding protein YlqC (UPF0109 family)
LCDQLGIAAPNPKLSPNAMQEFLEYVVKGLVQKPEAVRITPVNRAGLTVYELRLDPSDVGKIIGRQGATINAIRSLLLAGSAKRGLRCSLEIVEEGQKEGQSTEAVQH